MSISCRSCGFAAHLGNCVDAMYKRAEKAEAELVQLRHVEDQVLICQKLIDEGMHLQAIEHLETVYVGGAMKRDLEKLRTADSVSDMKGEKT